jgi:hypothetical protein
VNYYLGRLLKNLMPFTESEKNVDLIRSMCNQIFPFLFVSGVYRAVEGPLCVKY